MRKLYVTLLIAAMSVFFYAPTADAQAPYLWQKSLFAPFVTGTTGGVISADTISASINTIYADWVTIDVRCDSISGTNPAYVLKALVSSDGTDWDTVVFWLTDSLEAETDVQQVFLSRTLTSSYFQNAGAATSVIDSVAWAVAHEGRTGPPVLRNYLKVFLHENVDSGAAVFDCNVSVMNRKEYW